jgi:hypothetical protein
MGDIVLLYYSCSDIPPGVDGNPNLYGLMCIVVRKYRFGQKDLSMETFINSRRGLWLRWKRHDRDPQDYMGVYEYSSKHTPPPGGSCANHTSGIVRGIVLCTFLESELPMLLYRLALRWDSFNFVKSNFIHLMRKYPIR